MRITASQDSLGSSLKNPKVAIVVSPYYKSVAKNLENGAIQCLSERAGVEPSYIVEVPGAFEIPLAVRQLLKKDDVDAVVALGLVIQGETPHFDYVCLAAERGCSLLQMEFNKPVGFGVLTTNTMAQAQARSGGPKGNKGHETCGVVLDMLEILKKIEG